VHTHLAPRTLIRFLFLIRLIMPQVKNLSGIVGLLAILSTPNRHLGGRMCA
jgi:hypothetical protein